MNIRKPFNKMHFKLVTTPLPQDDHEALVSELFSAKFNLIPEIPFIILNESSFTLVFVDSLDNDVLIALTKLRNIKDSYIRIEQFDGFDSASIRAINCHECNIINIEYDLNYAMSHDCRFVVHFSAGDISFNKL